MIQAYWFSGSAPAWRMLLALEAKGLSYKSVQISGAAGDHMKPEFLALNRRHKVPVLVDGDLVMTELLAIMGYLDDKYPEPALSPETPEGRARMWRFMTDFEANAMPKFVFDFAIPVFFGRLDGNEDAFRDGYAFVREELDHVETLATGGNWLMGDAMTLADLAFYPVHSVVCRVASKPEVAEALGGVPDLAADYPALEAWRARMAALPYHDKTWPPGWTD